MALYCNLCQDRGIILQEDTAIQCSCIRQRTIENRFRFSRLPPAMAQYDFKNFNLKYYSKNEHFREKDISYYESACRTLQASQNYIDEFLANPHTDGLLFTGQVGNGKTYLACCIANALMQREQTVLFVVVPDLLDLIRATYDHNKQPGTHSEQQLLDTARSVPMLILDDLGAHNYTEWTRNKIYSILNYRLNHRLPVIITTNINLEDLEEHLGERTTSRIFQMCRPYRLMVNMDIRAVQRSERI